MGWGIVCIAMVLINLVLGHFLLERLRNFHTAVWQQLGRPTLRDSNLGSARRRFFGFVWSLHFRALHDSKVSSLGWAVLLAELSTVVSFAAFLLS
jgi:hypothetical protein